MACPVRLELTTSWFVVLDSQSLVIAEKLRKNHITSNYRSCWLLVLTHSILKSADVVLTQRRVSKKKMRKFPTGGIYGRYRTRGIMVSYTVA